MFSYLSILFSDYKTKNLLTPWKLGSTRQYKWLFWDYIDTFEWYIFQLIFGLNPDLSRCNFFEFSWVGKVTNGI